MQENHSWFTNLSVVGIGIGGGLGFRLGSILPVTLGFAAGFALLGILIDWLQYRRKQDKNEIRRSHSSQRIEERRYER